MVNKAQPERTSFDHPLDDPFHLLENLEKYIQPGSTLLLALSGGVDSVVLLHQLNALRQRFPFELHAMHVNHGLNPNADQWAAHCQWLCQQYRISFTIARVNVSNDGLGIEAAARQARYQALFNYKYRSASPEWVVTAHHQADQAETFLLQLLRGAGVKGLSAMASSAADKRLFRPMLPVSKQTILAYAKRYKLSWCEDESNQSMQFDRNFLRQKVIPVLKERYPSLDDTLSQVANQMAESQGLLAVLAQKDAKEMIDGPCLNIAGLCNISDARFHNVLRFWFECQQLDMPSRKRLLEIAKQLRDAKSDASVRLEHQGHVLLRYDGFAYLYHVSALPECVAFELCWNGESSISLPSGSRVNFNYVTGRGIDVKHLSTPLLIRSRRGGEQLKLNQNRPKKPLKQWFQEARVPPWVREVTPLFYLADQLVYVPGVGVAESYVAAPDEPGLEITVDIEKNNI